MNNEILNWSKLRRLALCPALRLVLGFTLLSHVAHGQRTQSQSDQLAASIANLKLGDFLNVDVEAVARAGAGQAVLPELERKFASATDVASQNKIANALVRLGDKNNTYWNFLLEQATLAIDSDLPDPFHDSKGNAMEHELSPEINAWAQAHHVDFSKAAHSALYDLPGKVMLLGETGDTRAIPLLRRALWSHNAMIVVMAAKGLAKSKTETRYR